jgi:quercetin dioxygenase-like cupin family protein
MSTSFYNGGFKVASGESRSRRLQINWLSVNVFDAKVSEKDTSGNLTIFETTALSKGGPPLHVHPDQDEVVEVKEGEYDVQVGNERFNLKPGDMAFMPRNVPHTWRQRSDKGRMIFTFQPSGKMEDFFAKASLWASLPSQIEMTKFFEEHQMKIVGPPLKEE